MSGESIPYHLRLNKNIERQIFIDLLMRLSSYKPIWNYLYIGFGGPFLEDFKILHNHFDISEMYSIDMSSEVISRQEFNKPASCITCIETTSTELIDNYPQIKDVSGTELTQIDQEVMVWLDFTSPSELKDQILDFTNLIDKVVLNSIVKITVNANPSSLLAMASLPPLPSGVIEGGIAKEERLRTERLLKLEERLGSYFQRDISDESMMESTKYPDLLHLTIMRAVNSTLRGSGSTFLPLSSFKYKDGQQMLTLTGILLDNDNVEEFRGKNYNRRLASFY